MTPEIWRKILSNRSKIFSPFKSWKLKEQVIFYTNFAQVWWQDESHSHFIPHWTLSEIKLAYIGELVKLQLWYSIYKNSKIYHYNWISPQFYDGMDLKILLSSCSAKKVKFPIKDFSSKCDQIRSFLRIWSHLLEKSLMEDLSFCAVLELYYYQGGAFYKDKCNQLKQLKNYKDSVSIK